MENKINIACFKEGSRTAEVKDIWQWDYGQILRIQGLNLPTAVEIHFSLDEHGGEAVRRIGVTKDGVTDVPIPDSMVENESAYGDSYYFFAYIYLTDETSGNTEYKIRAKVSTRSKPEGYVSGGNDTFAEILKTVNEIAEDKVDIPVPAKVGQVIAVSEVDEDGRPTGFEATPIEESDPTVPEWAKQPEKPSYTASEVGALPDTTKIPSKTSDLQNDSGFLTEYQDLSGYALKSEVPKSASDVGADAAGTAVAKVSEHNTASNTHNDIRLLVQGLTERLNALADSDDETLDQMSEVVAYIKSNKSLIDAITTSKVNVSDIIDNLTTNVSNKPLSAAQGVKLKALIDAIAIPTKLSELENDSGYAKTTDIPDKLPNPQKLTFTGAVTAEYNGSGAVTVTIPEGSGGSGGMVRIEKLSTDTSVELEPNKLYIFPEMAELTITLAEPSDTGIVNEYHFVFQSGSTPTALAIPSAIKLPSEFAVEANKVYRLSILEGCLIAHSWTRGFTFHVKIDSSLDYPYLFLWEIDKNENATIWGDNWPGEPMKENENGWFTRELPHRQHNGQLYCIVTCEAGNKQTLDIDIDDSKSDVWITVNASYEYMVYYEEPTI